MLICVGLHPARGLAFFVLICDVRTFFMSERSAFFPLSSSGLLATYRTPRAPVGIGLDGGHPWEAWLAPFFAIGRR